MSYARGSRTSRTTRTGLEFASVKRCIVSGNCLSLDLLYRSRIRFFQGDYSAYKIITFKSSNIVQECRP